MHCVHAHLVVKHIAGTVRKPNSKPNHCDPDDTAKDELNFFHSEYLQTHQSLRKLHWNLQPQCAQH